MSTLEILHSREAFKLIKGKPQSSYVEGIIRHLNQLYLANRKNRTEPPTSLSSFDFVQPSQLRPSAL